MSPHPAGGGRRRAAALAPPAGGFTIIELMIVVVLAGVLGATVVSLFRAQSSVFRGENQALEVDQNLRAALDLMLRELRNAGMKDPLQPYAEPPGVLVAESQRVRFTMDFHSTAALDGTPDGDVEDPNEDIEYSYTPSDGTVRRRTRGAEGDSGAQPMAELVSGVRFTYFDAAGDTIPTPVAAAALPAIRRIALWLEGTPVGAGPSPTAQSDVVPRNLAY
jgi:type IV pilus assembly protein PilW